MSTPASNLDFSGLAALIDHTLLKPEATRSDILQLCAQAREHHFAAACVNGCWIGLAARELNGAHAKVAGVVGFPLGAGSTQSKLAEAREALAEGASELDMVQNLGALRGGDARLVQDEIAALADAAHSAHALLKVILETSLLSEGEKKLACRLAVEAGADFVKTSTGFSTGGATAADVRLMRAEVGKGMGVKASGGIRSLAVLREMAAAGANRIGTSSGVAILQEFVREQETGLASAAPTGPADSGPARGY